MSSSVDAVVIAAADVLQDVRAQVGGEGPVLTFTDGDMREALEALAAHRPARVVLERLFAASPRGTAFIGRIRADPHLQHAEIRVVSPDGSYSRIVARPDQVSSARAEPAAPLDQTGTRRALRVPIREGVDVHVDGSPALLVDLSVFGAQVTSPTTLRPNQRVRLALPDGRAIVRVSAAIAWASFEQSLVTGRPQYRAGLEFSGADPAAIEAFCAKYKA